MNLMAKNAESGEEKEEKEQQPPTVGPLLSPFSSSYHHHHNHHQQPFFPPPQLGGWLADFGGPSSDQNEQLGWMMVEREHMFDKVVTPSDVGKLNRLVIPKQHAERFFPLDSSTNYKGLLLNFEDKNGKLWRFQYSYWNSSQSYVMTKGWSRFVKEKKLDAGDVVSFQRGVGVTAKDRLFIDWKRRVNPSSQPHHSQLISSSSSSSASADLAYMFHNHNINIHPWNPLVLQSLPASRNLDFMLQEPKMNPNSSRSVYFEPQQFKMTQRCELGLGFDPEPSVVHGRSSGKRLRLFGVNMDCVFSEDDEDDRDTTVAGCSTVNSLLPSSSSIPYLQLTPYGQETECDQSKVVLSVVSSAHDFNKITKSAVSKVSLDLKMSQTEAEI